MIPLFRWVGSKKALADRIVSVMPENFGRYHEPFCGSAAVFFELREQRRPFVSTLSDLNPELINFWRMMKDGTGPESYAKPLRRQTVHAIGNLVKFGTDLETYRMVRASQLTDPVRRAARFWYLQSLCFNGLWRENQSGGHNVPHGKRSVEPPGYYDFDTAHCCLQGTTLRHRDAMAACDDVERGDLVYLDPPYADTFTGYVASDWTPLHLAELIDRAHQLASRGACVVLSEQDTPLTRGLLKHRASFASFNVRQGVAASAAARGERRELLAVFPVRGRRWTNAAASRLARVFR